jgi:hypothetical protein
VHVPKVLYHWRVTEGSMSTGVGAKDYAYASAGSALKHFLQLNGLRGQVCQGSRYGTYRVQVEVQGDPLVEIRLDVTGEPEDLIRSMVGRIRTVTEWPNFRVCLTGTGEEANTEKAADYLILMRARTEVTRPDWIARLAEFCQLPGVGAVGPRVFGCDGAVQSAGMLFIGERLQPAYAGSAQDDPGYFLSAQVPRNYLAVSGACLMTKAALFEQLGGLDGNLPPDLRAIDYCLRLHERGLRTVVTPYTEVTHPAEPVPELTTEFRSRWAHYIRSDPYYSPNLPREYAYYPRENAALKK